MHQLCRQVHIVEKLCNHTFHDALSRRLLPDVIQELLLKRKHIYSSKRKFWLRQPGENLLHRTLMKGRVCWRDIMLAVQTPMTLWDVSSINQSVRPLHKFMGVFCAKNLYRTKYFYKLLTGHEYFHTEFEYHATKKATLLFFESRSIFPNFHTADKHIYQSQWLCGADITSISHNNNINNNDWYTDYRDNVRQSITDLLAFANSNVSLSS